MQSSEIGNVSALLLNIISIVGYLFSQYGLLTEELSSGPGIETSMSELSVIMLIEFNWPASDSLLEYNHLTCFLALIRPAKLHPPAQIMREHIHATCIH